jgi:iron complex transport system permease protein
MLRDWIERGRGGRLTLFFVLLVVLLIAVTIVAIAIGSTPIAPGTVARVLASRLLPFAHIGGVDETETIVIWIVRTPRVLVAALVGAALAIAGAQMQGLFQNPMASPDVIATSSGAALGAVLAIALGFAQLSLFWLPLWAFVGALISLVIVYSLTTRGGHTPIAMLLLAGVALNALIGALIAFVVTLRGVRFEVAQEILFWVMGGLDSRLWTHVWICAPCIVVGVVVSLLFARELDLFLAGEETAASLGVDVQRVKRVVLVTAALLTGAAVAVSGVIGFVGLIVPHVVRLLVGPAHRRVIPASGLIGATFLVMADLLARTVRPPQEVALGIITAAVGAPFFLYLLVKQRRQVGYL